MAAKGVHNIGRPLDAGRDVPVAARLALDLLADQLHDLQSRIDSVTTRIASAQKDDALGPSPRHRARPPARRVERPCRCEACASSQINCK